MTSAIDELADLARRMRGWSADILERRGETEAAAAMRAEGSGPAREDVTEQGAPEDRQAGRTE